MHLLLVGIVHMALGLWFVRQRRTMSYVYGAALILVGAPFVWWGGEALAIEVGALLARR